MTADTHGASGAGWVGVDLDGTLAAYHGWRGPEHIGVPIPLMVNRVIKWKAQGKDVRIMTARVSPGKGDSDVCRTHINNWMDTYLGFRLPITHEKDHKMIELWDDRVVQVIPNTGVRADGKDE